MDIDHNGLAQAKKINISDQKKITLIMMGVTILITTIPYLLGFFVVNEQLVFSGFLFGVEDGNSYIAKMMLGASGDWLFRTPYSVIHQEGLFAFFPYLLLGKLAAGLGLHAQLVSIFQLFRIGGILFLVYVYTRFLFLYLNDKKIIILGLFLLLFGSGWDWIMLFFSVDRLPLSFYSPETFGFLSILGLPHLCFSRGFMLLGIFELLQWDHSITKKPFLRSGIYFLAAAVFQPLNLVIAYLVFGLWWIILFFRKKFHFSWHLFWNQSITIIISLPMFIYYFWIVNLDPFMKQWTAQNILPSPPVIDYILAFAPLFFILLLEIARRRNLKNLFQDEKRFILVLWIIFSFGLVYYPINVQRRLMDGVWSAHVILFLLILRTYKSRIFHWIMVLSMVISPIILLLGAIMSLLNPTEPQFLNKSRLEIYKHLGMKAPKNAVVLAPYKISNEIPAYTNLRVLNGHGPESLNKKETEKFLDDLYNYEITHRTACEFLNNNLINYVWFDAFDYDELKIQSIFQKNEVELMINQSGHAILQINKCEP